MDYFIADTHFMHKNIIRFCGRPFTSVGEMDAVLLDNWNRRVRDADTVFILGDLFHRAKEPERILRELRGKKHLVTGNHDGRWLCLADFSRHFESIDTMIVYRNGGNVLTLCHYPMLSYPYDRGQYMIHGHIHNDTSADFWPLLAVRERVLNAGVDINGFQPVTFQELIANNAAFKALHPGT